MHSMTASRFVLLSVSTWPEVGTGFDDLAEVRHLFNPNGLTRQIPETIMNTCRHNGHVMRGHEAPQMQGSAKD
jgi:hypothetical protein